MFNFGFRTGYDSATGKVTIVTNNKTGFTLTAQASSSTLTNPDNSDYSISGITSDTSESTFSSDASTLNKWGISIVESGTTKTFKSPATTFSLTTSAATTTVYDFSVATRIDGSLASGAYAGAIVFTPTSNPVPVTLAEAYQNNGGVKSGNYYTMQSMTPTICAASDLDETGIQVIDTRAS